MKKFLAIVLALVMVLALAACNNDEPTKTTPSTSGGGTTSEPPTTQPEETEPPKPADAEPLPAEALNHWDFESADGLNTVHQVPRPVESELTGVGTDKFDIVESKHEPILADGPVGKAVYLDGKYGIKLDMTAPTDDSYTIAFWYNGDRFITLGPIIQMGRNVGMADNADPASAVTWFNICQCAWGVDGASLTPTVWNRNSSIGTDIAEGGVWPWVAGDTVYGKKEWAHVAIVVDGVRYTADDGMERIGCKLYINGVLMFDANSENLFYQGVAPEIFKDSDKAIRGLEAYIGINYWDACYKGFIDDLYVYDEALTAGQVTSLYNLGNPSVTSTAPEYTGPTDDAEGGEETPTVEPIDPDTLTAAPVDSNAIVALGTPERTLGFWTEHTASYELPEGKAVTFKLNNYSSAKANYMNFCTVLCGIPMDADKVGPNDLEGYVEYAVVRPDNWAWSGTVNPIPDLTYEASWGDDWTSWLNLMTDAEVTLTLTRTGTTVAMEYTFTGADGTVMTEKVNMPLNASAEVAADAPVYAFIGGEGAYIELLSVE